VPIAKPWLGEAEAAAARRVILSGWVTQGPEVAAFESEFADFAGAAHACAVSSCTAALHLAMIAMGIGEGDEVIVPSHSYIATANAVRYVGASPVFVDIEPHGFNLDPARIEAAISDRSRLILCVHQMGMPCHLEQIVELARRHSLAVIEDAACAVGSRIRWDGDWQNIGRPHADIACFSFHPRKVITTGDGGMLTTEDPKIHARLQLLRQHGMSATDVVRHRSAKVIFESYEELGFNYRMTDIQAAVGREQLKRLPQMVARRREIAAVYRAELPKIAGLRVPDEPEWCRSNWQSYCVRLPPGKDQRGIMQNLLDLGISTRRGIMCAHREPAYNGHPLPHELTESEAAQDSCILIPMYHALTELDQLRVIEGLERSLA
jgi:dTDP-4-amino-4,6-dideoxygalactose transaminase